ncbi:uncharacterized protein SPSK_10107 [Sporothrix schenckii 1099-18]|uniref:Uncharacterized protein n=1 Tax=Sporothrix schenckii 1099-18 TaxID=1397361 RepID=A0A0F2M6G0_SPOSC|nr:uncharacterized protein SPSK_10107 [Sporothrix schenckii 1099-18]KJR85278.1 hypothetical protein SPSK_10107 [Sporothrix schenckii 1099-18]
MSNGKRWLLQSRGFLDGVGGWVVCSVCWLVVLALERNDGTASPGGWSSIRDQREELFTQGREDARVHGGIEKRSRRTCGCSRKQPRAVGKGRDNTTCENGK